VVTEPTTGLRAHNQSQRRERIIRAAAALASRGGIDAVQMRAVAERAGVALGTLYRYFPSKMDLVAAVISEELGHLEASIRRRPPAGPKPSLRAADVLIRATRGLMREPELADALVRSMILSGEAVQEDFGDRLARLILHATRTEDRTGAALLVSVWVTQLLHLLRGKITLQDLDDIIHIAAARLLRPA
jgi:TetR/AcrR family transcriptional regulator, cholesterol catabolism regulator